jgi:hypothetical protein
VDLQQTAMSDKPQRIQLRRTKGWKMPPNTVKVDRSTRWGNPFVDHDWRASFRAVFLGFRGDRNGRTMAAVQLYRMWLTSDRESVATDERNFWEKEVMTLAPDRMAPTVDEVRAELRGKNLACWCPLDQPCHADILLELANG